jgi:PhnB protein
VIEDWSNALRTKDADAVVAHHAPDFVQFSLAPPLRSDAADAKSLRAWFSTWEGPLGYEIRDLDIAVGDEAAFCHSLNRLSGTKTGGHRTVLWFRLTLGFRKIGGAWRIAHEHESVPFYMDGSFKAALDLKP